MKAQLRLKLKQILLDRWKIPYSPVSSIPPGIYHRLKGIGPLFIVDVGAYRGDFTLAMKEVSPLRKAVLVEPIEELAAELTRNPELKDFEVHNCVVAGDSNSLTFSAIQRSLHFRGPVKVTGGCS